MNKFFLHIAALLILFIPIEATAQTICLQKEDKKVIGISNESVFEVKEDCTVNEVEIEFKELPQILFQNEEISHITVRKATIEEAIELLKKTKRKFEKTEDLMKLIDFLPTAMPLQISIIEFVITTVSDTNPPIQLEFDFLFNTRNVGIVLIDSQNVIIDQIKNHKVITIPNI